MIEVICITGVVIIGFFVLRRELILYCRRRTGTGGCGSCRGSQCSCRNTNCCCDCTGCRKKRSCGDSACDITSCGHKGTKADDSDCPQDD